MPALVPFLTLSEPELIAFRNTRHFVPVGDAVFAVEGSGALECLQGLLTNDVMKAADRSATWGAFLTPKGMIITDAWVLRDELRAWVLVPGAMRETAQQLFARTIPPRLARVTDRSAEVTAHWICGGIPSTVSDADQFTPHPPAPFASLLLSHRSADAEHRPESIAKPAPSWYADLAKLLLGWPTLGREIDERTLPQEVRFDELGGVRYDKGCYTGQETVARLHFRGHANRVLRGVCWAPGDQPTDTALGDGARVVGTLRTTARIGDRSVALAMIRHEIAIGDMVRAGESEAVVVEPPFDLGELAVA